MAGFYERRKSRAALWCWRLAVISLPFFILTIFLHRSASITTQQAFWLIAFGIAMLLASLVFGVKAAMDLWEKGYQGGRATVKGCGPLCQLRKFVEDNRKIAAEAKV